MHRICFVCLGNICRSPLAEGVFKHLAHNCNRDNDFHVESAGIGGWHVGESPDVRAQRVAHENGISLNSRAQKFTARDFQRFDLVLALDADIHTDLHELAQSEEARHKIRLLREFDPDAHGQYDVPDPYYGGYEGFQHTFVLIDRACRQLLETL